MKQCFLKMYNPMTPGTYDRSTYLRRLGQQAVLIWDGTFKP